MAHKNRAVRLDIQEGGADGAATVMVDSEAEALVVRGWTSNDAEVVAWAEAQDAAELPERFAAVVKLGILASQTVAAAATVEDVRREFERMRTTLRADLDSLFGEGGVVTKALEAHFGDDGLLETTLNDYLGKDGKLAEQFEEAIGEDGEFERRVKAFIGPKGELSKLMAEYLGEEGELERIMSEFVGDEGKLKEALDEVFGEKGDLHRELERVFGTKAGLVYQLLNPANEEAPLGKLKKNLLDIMDVRREDSPFRLLKKDLDEIKIALGARKASQEMAERGTQKGVPFQDRVLEALTTIALRYSDEVRDTSNEPGPLGNVGDGVAVLNHVGASVPRIAIEVKSGAIKLKGNDSLWRELAEARENRAASITIGVVSQKHRPVKAEQLEFSQPSKAILVFVDDEHPHDVPLEAAYKLARTLAISEVKVGSRQVTAAEITAYTGSIRRSLELIQAMKRGLTSTTSKLTELHGDLEKMRQEIIEQLDELEARAVEPSPQA